VLDLAHPHVEGVCKPGSGYVFKPELTNNNEAVQQLLYSGRLVDFYTRFFGEPIRHYDFTWLRAIGPGKGTNPHCDLPYMGRGTHRHMTCWLPYGDISFTLGGLMVLEGSHKRMDLLENYVYRDVDAFCENKPKEADAAKKAGKWSFTGTLSHNPPIVRNKFGGRWLTTEFKAGDFITFGMFLVHASLDNRSENRLRISSDSRYQRASEPIDERWVGINPPGHSTAGKRGRICIFPGHLIARTEAMVATSKSHPAGRTSRPPPAAWPPCRTWPASSASSSKPSATSSAPPPRSSTASANPS
jgi:hypothetical protein